MRNRLARKEKSVEQSTVRKSAKGSAVMVARIIELALYRAQRSLAEDEKADASEKPARKTARKDKKQASTASSEDAAAQATGAQDTKPAQTPAQAPSPQEPKNQTWGAYEVLSSIEFGIRGIGIHGNDRVNGSGRG